MIFDDLPGRFEIRVSGEGAYFSTTDPDVVAVLVEQYLEEIPIDPEGPPRASRPYRAGMVRVTKGLLEDAHAGLFETVIEAHLEHIFRPWAFPDSDTACPWPTIVLFPRLLLLEHLARSSRRRRTAWLDVRYLAARRVRALADLVEGDQGLP